MRHQLAYPFQFCLRLIVLCLSVVLLAGCGSEAGQSPNEPSRTAPSLVDNLPSISELAGTPAAEIPPLPALDPAEIDLGQALYDTHCSECHGPNLEGEDNWQTPNEDGSFRAPPHDAGGHTWHHGDEVLIESIRLGGSRLKDLVGGTSNMPSFEQTLSEAEMRAILTFIKGTWPDDIRLVQWERTVQAP